MKKIELKGSEVSKAIKDLLKAKYPKCKISVRYESFAGGDAVRIEYEYGPSKDSVNELVKPFEKGHFNSMDDSYEFHGERKAELKEGEVMLSGGVKFISVSKPFPKDMFAVWKEKALVLLRGINDQDEVLMALRTVYSRTDFQSSEPKDVNLVANFSDGGPVWSRLGFDFLVEEPVSEPAAIELLPYSDYSFAVFGQAFHLSAKLREVGNYNKHLKHPVTQVKTPGWIFATKNLNRVKQILQLP